MRHKGMKDILFGPPDVRALLITRGITGKFSFHDPSRLLMIQRDEPQVSLDSMASISHCST